MLYMCDFNTKEDLPSLYVVVDPAEDSSVGLVDSDDIFTGSQSG